MTGRTPSLSGLALETREMRSPRATTMASMSFMDVAEETISCHAVYSCLDASLLPLVRDPLAAFAQPVPLGPSAVG